MTFFAAGTSRAGNSSPKWFAKAFSAVGERKWRSGPKITENGSQRVWNGQNRWDGHEENEKWPGNGSGRPICVNLRSFAVHFGQLEGSGWPKNPVFYRKWTQIGGQEQPGRDILAGKQEIFMKTGGERALIQFSCVSCFSAWVVGSDGCRDTAG
jgi:hypothetical protein